MYFGAKIQDIQERLEQVDPIRYAVSRNFIDGAVSGLSPYISRGVLSTRQVLQHFLSKGISISDLERFVQELAWRDYWQQIWISRKNEIDADWRNVQTLNERKGLPLAIMTGETGIQAIDFAIGKFYETGYLHNHVRMYLASLATNFGRCHWKIPAQWMYFHLLDADWASNALSWQWVCGVNSKKLYFFNQENVNTFCYSEQKNTFIDAPYDQFPLAEIPSELMELADFSLTTQLPEQQEIQIDPKRWTCLYTFYNMDFEWRASEKVNRVLILEPSHFEHYPISQKTLQFLLSLGENIPNLQIFVGEYDDFIKTYPSAGCYFKEHPCTSHFRGVQDEREWISSVKGEFPSFFVYWKKVKKELWKA